MLRTGKKTLLQAVGQRIGSRRIFLCIFFGLVLWIGPVQEAQRICLHILSSSLRKFQGKGPACHVFAIFFATVPWIGPKNQNQKRSTGAMACIQVARCILPAACFAWLSFGFCQILTELLIDVAPLVDNNLGRSFHVWRNSGFGPLKGVSFKKGDRKVWVSFWCPFKTKKGHPQKSTHP